ncbi:hypothetical protein M422DRAFT_35748 [Sphaerobolus stellatus SS14]|uniref:Uncharacterized protein n=1 Tax=Sphaerobolus stellatus (strain SS14) TaxID=990650 RepID=A0A0C9V5C8_SPHS4|nr:hypothetical protein M422DRAFT_35748 [Sphaerobolus stellatus SS14]
MPSLRYFSGYVDWERLEEFTAAIPQVKRLHANPARGLQMNSSERPLEIKKTIRSILQLKELTHLSGLLTGQMFTYKVLEDSNILKRIAKLPNLEYIYVPNPHDAEQWLRICRSDKGKCVGFDWLEEGVVEHPYNWGDFFQGFVRKY